MVLGQVGMVYSDYFLLEWCSSSSSSSASSNERLLGVYALLVFGTVVLAYVRTASFFRASLKASSTLHSRMLLKVVKAPMSWFHR